MTSKPQSEGFKHEKQLSDLLSTFIAIRDLTVFIDNRNGDLTRKLENQQDALDAIRNIAYFRIRQIERRRDKSNRLPDTSGFTANSTELAGPRPDRCHPQFQRLLRAFDMLHEVFDAWCEDEVAYYPQYLPSFDEFVCEFEQQMFAIEWK